MNGLPFELAVFNSDMLNDESHIYFDMERVTHGFGFVKFPIEGDLKESIGKACRKLYANAYSPSLVLIPLKSYSNVIIKERANELHFHLWLKMFGLTPFIMTPDYIKDHMTL